jgi:hypothetical protein
MTHQSLGDFEAFVGQVLGFLFGRGDQQEIECCDNLWLEFWA